ncbi:MAG: AAA family ATPase [Alphaproteobacteria bacterium]|nr:AAA family ATPase [Alphaproteobacteria bacterium]
MDIADWLRGLGLAQYEPAFRENEIDASVLPSLTAEDLRELGVAVLGHRRKLLDAIAELRRAPLPRSEEPGPAASPAAGEAPPTPASPTAERRQLTVMFCDLVGSTALSTRFDPEDLREVIAAYHRAVGEIISAAGGFISRYMGDGVLVYFGYPQAHEDDAERAVRAGLAAIEAVCRLDVRSVRLQTRVGIATGLVVVGDVVGEGPAQEQSVVGETPNLAARLQALAEPDTVVIAAGTRRLLGSLFEYRDLGRIEIKGIARPVAAWQVLRRSIVASRFEALRGSALTRLVDREEEVDLLLRRWARAKAGDGQIVLLSGEPGIGKSRITAELEQRLRLESYLRLRFFCSPYHQDSALFPFVDQLVRASGFADDDPAGAKLDKLEGWLATAVTPYEDVALLADLLSLPALERRPLPAFSPQRKKERTLEALLRQFESLARQQPVLMVFEDAHWIDPTSRELLDLIVERARSLSVLLVVTFRPDFQSPWIGQPQVTVLALNRLDRRDRAALIAQIAGGKALPDEVAVQIADRTDGIPLFVEELTKSVLESGLLREEVDRYALDRALPPLAIPSTLYDSLLARLDRLASVRLVAQIGAAIGREFSYALLRAVARLPDSELEISLARLVASELVFQRGAPPEALYTFKHALVQEAVHGSLLRSSRQQLHAQIAEALETQSPELMDSQPELFAQHYAGAGLVEKSAAYWGQAGRRSAARSAMAEAAAQYQKGLDQLALLPANPDRQRQELEFSGALAAVLNAVKGPAARETGQAYTYARQLWEELGYPSGYLHVPYGQSRYHMYCGEYDLALRLDDGFLRLSRERNNAGGLVLAHASSGRNLLFVGKFAMSRSHLDAALALYDPIAHGSLVHQAGNYPHVGSQAYLGNALFCLGFPEQALQLSNAAIAAAQRLAHLPSLAASLAISARLLSLVGDSAALGERADQLIAVTTERSFPFWRAQGTIYRGWAKAKNGDPAEGISLLRSGLSAFRGTGAEMSMPHFTGLLAGACAIGGRVEEALALFEDASQIAERTGEHWFSAELYRHKGELLLRQEYTEAAEELCRKALTVATEQEAKLWELRAAMSLARLWGMQGRRAQARDLLAPVYDWFTEGSDTQDLIEAKALVNELS